MAGTANQALAVLDGLTADNGEGQEAALRRSSRMELRPPAAEIQSQSSGTITAGQTVSFPILSMVRCCHPYPMRIYSSNSHNESS
jgi:hypothetical protein